MKHITARSPVAYGRLLLCALAIMVNWSVTEPARAAAFFPTGSMEKGRLAPTATLLTNGKVLAVEAGAAIYDPKTEMWTGTDYVYESRTSHTATLLPDGKVLVAGGIYKSDHYTGEDPLDGAELYDPVSGVWTNTGSLNVARYGHTATLLSNGKVLVCGGYNGVNQFGIPIRNSSAELYDPATGSWLMTGSMTHSRGNHTATLLKNGKVLVVAGNYATGDDSGDDRSTELYDPATKTWSTNGHLIYQHHFHTATLMTNGQVMVVSYNKSELFNPTNRTWSAVSNLLNYAHFSHTATLLTNGWVLVAGGSSVAGYPNGTDVAELFNPATKTWTATADMVTARKNHAAILLPNGRVLTAGGTRSNGNSLTNCEVFDSNGAVVEIKNLLQSYDGLAKKVSVTTIPSGLTVNVTYNGSTSAPVNVGSYTIIARINHPILHGSATNTLTITPWIKTSNMPDERQHHTATRLSDGKVLLVGGNNRSYVPLTCATVYNPVMRKWKNTGPTMAAGRLHHTATLLPDGKVLVTGGSVQGGYTNGTELFDPISQTWTNGRPMAAVRHGHSATLLSNGKVLVAGGRRADGVPLDSCEVYDPNTGQWTGSGKMKEPRNSHTATLLLNGKVLIGGGDNNSDPYFGGFTILSTAELYDPVSMTWTNTGSMAEEREGHSATLLNNGLVMICAGWSGASVRSSVELYDPAAGTWTNAASLNEARFSHTATLLSDGKLLVAGGADFRSAVFSRVEIYDPVSGLWSNMGSMLVNRSDHTATLLPDHKVLIAGGSYWDGTAELYDPSPGLYPEIYGSVSLPAGAVGVVYKQTFSMRGGIAPYIWAVTSGTLPPGLTLDSGVINGTPTALTNAEFIVQVTDSNGLSSRRGFNLSVTNGPGAPIITAQPQGRVITSGSNIIFSVTATSSTPLTYQWRFNGTNLAGATRSSYNITNVQPRQAGNYSVTVSNNAGVLISSNAFLAVKLLVTSLATGNGSIAPTPNVLVHPGSSQTFAATAFTNFTVGEWYLDGNRKQTGGATYSLSNIQTNHAVKVVFRPLIKLYWQNTNGSSSEWRFNGTNFISNAQLPWIHPAWQMVGQSDFNSDGNADLLYQNAVGQMLLATLNGTSRVRTNMVRNGLAAPPGWKLKALSDFNNDAQTDFLFQTSTNRLATWLMSKGTNYLTNILMQPLTSGWRVVGMTDFNGDTKKDILWQNSSGNVAVWFMNGRTNIGSINLFSNKTVAAGWDISALADMDFNGQKDILAQNSKGQVQVWLMNRTNFLKSVLLRNGATNAPGWQLKGPK